MTPSSPDHLYVLAVGAQSSERRFLRDISGSTGWRLHEADSCATALSYLREHPVEVVLCAPEMPDGTWRWLLERLQALTSPPELVVFSRLADCYLWGEVLNLGGCDVIATPFEKGELLHVVNVAWRQWQRERLGRRPATI